MDVRQAEQLVFTARGQIVDLQRRIEQQENALSVLLGETRDRSSAARALTEQSHAPEVPEGLPSALLDRRPDIQQAEQEHRRGQRADRRREGVVLSADRADRFGGVASTALSSLFTAGTWAVGVSAVQPIFNAGRTRSQVALAEARRQEAEIAYRQTIQRAFREVSDAIIGYRRLREFRETQEELLARRRTRGAWRICAIRAARPAISKCSTATRACSSRSSASCRRSSASWRSSSKSYRSLGGGWQS